MEHFKHLPTITADAVLTVATVLELPVSGVFEGSIRYVEDINQLYTFDGSAWAAIGAGISAGSLQDTNSISLALVVGKLTADLKLSSAAADASNLKATTSIKSDGLHIELPFAATGQTGVLTNTDWNTFNGKQAALGFTPESVLNKNQLSGYAGLDAGGQIAIGQIPAAAIERLVVVADATARHALTTATVQNGDTVKQTDTGEMWYVFDATQLNVDAGYRVYTAGTASAVPWSGVTSKPDNVVAMAALSGPGIVTKTSTDPASVTFAQRTIVGTANRISVSNGDGAAANPTINLDTTQFPQAGAGDVGLPLVTSAANTASWALPQSTVDLNQSGFVSWGGSGDYYSFVHSTGVFTILRPGVGRINSLKTTWTAGLTVTLTAGKSYFISLTATNTLVATDWRLLYDADVAVYMENLATFFKTHVMLFSIYVDAIDSGHLVMKQNHPYDYASEIAAHDHFRLGHVFIGNGGLISPLVAANRTIQTTGNAALDDHGNLTHVHDAAGVAMTTNCMFQNAGGTASMLNRQDFVVTVGTPVVGDVYTNNGSSFTILGFAGGIAYTWQSAGVTSPLASGTLTRSSGTGSATLTYTSVTAARVIPFIYAPAGVPTPLAAAGNTNRWGIYVIYASGDDLQTPNTTNPLPNYIVVPSNVAYSGSNTATAIASLGTGAAPDVSQFLLPPEIEALEPCLMGFALIDGNSRAIPVVTSNGFVNGVRSYRATAIAGGGAGAAAVANAINVSTSTTNFNGILSTADVNVQLALDTIDDHMTVVNVSSNVSLTRNRIHLVDTSSARSLTLPAPVSGHPCQIAIKDSTGGADTNNITIVRSGSEKIETVAASYVLSVPLGSTTLVDNGTDWFII